MKKQITLLAILFVAFTSMAQTGFNYKALITNNGNALSNHSVDVKFTILQGSSSVYQETQTTTTDVNGIVIANIGEGTVVSGDFTTIDWAIDSSLKVEIDTGSGYHNFGTSEFKSVPSAKYADKAGNAFSRDYMDLINKPAIFYKQGTTEAPSSINDRMYHNGNVGIGNFASINVTLNLKASNENSNHISVPQFNMFSEVSGNNDRDVIGYYNKMSATGNGNQYSFFSVLSEAGSGKHFGSYHVLKGLGSGKQYGVYDSINNGGASNHYGVYNKLNGNGSGKKYGIYNDILGGNGDKYGTYSLIDKTSGGIHYGIYSEVLKSSGYAGYFKGRMYVSDNVGFGTLQPAARLQTIPTGSISNGASVDVANAGLLVGTDTDGLAFDSNQIEKVGSGALYLNNNSSGNVIIAQGGGKVGIGTVSPSQLLHIKGHNASIKIEAYGRYADFRRFTNRLLIETNDMIQFGTGGGLDTDMTLEHSGDLKLNHKLTTPNTGTADMKAFAYGSIDSNGDVQNGSNNFSVSRITTGIYQVTFTGQNFDFDHFSVTVNLIGNYSDLRFVKMYNSSNKLIIRPRKVNGAGTISDTNNDFSFTVFKK